MLSCITIFAAMSGKTETPRAAERGTAAEITRARPAETARARLTEIPRARSAETPRARLAEMPQVRAVETPRAAGETLQRSGKSRKRVCTPSSWKSIARKRLSTG